jgi:hypothetical protein
LTYDISDLSKEDIIDLQLSIKEKLPPKVTERLWGRELVYHYLYFVGDYRTKIDAFRYPSKRDEGEPFGPGEYARNSTLDEVFGIPYKKKTYEQLNTLLVLTSSRILIIPSPGREITEQYSTQLDYFIPLSQILSTEIRETGFITKNIMLSILYEPIKGKKPQTLKIKVFSLIESQELIQLEKGIHLALSHLYQKSGKKIPRQIKIEKYLEKINSLLKKTEIAKLKTCPYCHKKITAIGEFCPVCGQKIKQM